MLWKKILCRNRPICLSWKSSLPWVCQRDCHYKSNRNNKTQPGIFWTSLRALRWSADIPDSALCGNRPRRSRALPAHLWTYYTSVSFRSLLRSALARSVGKWSWPLRWGMSSAICPPCVGWGGVRGRGGRHRPPTTPPHRRGTCAHRADARAWRSHRWGDVVRWWDEIWYDVMWLYDMICYDMICYDMICYDMIWWDGIGWDGIECGDGVWCDGIRCGDVVESCEMLLCWRGKDAE